VYVDSSTFWFQIISYSSTRGGVSVATERGETSRSVLLIQRARPSDSGNYQCNPSNARTANVTVHVLNGTFSEIVVVCRSFPGFRIRHYFPELL
jgi:hypothetical protein